MSELFFRNAKLLLVTVIIAAWILTPAFNFRSVHAQGLHALTFRNGSGYTINELYLSKSGREYWGPNLLRAPLGPNGSIRVPLAPGRYDMKLVDHEGYVCLTQVQVAGEASFDLTNEWLRRCEGRG